MPIFILVEGVVLLLYTKSASIMSFPARTINKTPLKFQGCGSEITTITLHVKKSEVSAHINIIDRIQIYSKTLLTSSYMDIDQNFSN